MCKVIAICISEKKGTKKIEVPQTELIIDFGLKGDAHGGNWHRQVSLLEKEKIDEFRKLKEDIAYGDFGENIVTEGINYTNLKIGDKIKINNAVLEITQFGKECHAKCEIFKTVGDCIMPRAGMFAKVIVGDIIHNNDNIIFV